MGKNLCYSAGDPAEIRRPPITREGVSSRSGRCYVIEADAGSIPAASTSYSFL